MKALFTLISLTLASNIASANQDAIEVIKTLLPGKKITSKIKTEGCQFKKQKWLESLLTSASFTEKISFNKDCDLQGEHTVAPNKPFPINLAIRSFKGYERLLTNFLYKIEFKEKPELIIQMKNAILKGKETIVFDMNYSLEVDIMSKDPLQKDKGGQIIIKKISNKVVNKTVPFKMR